MIDFAEIERLDFASSDALARLDLLLREVAGYAETRTAFEIVRILEEKLKANQKFSSVLDPYIVKFGTLALPLLPEKHVMTIMQHLTGVIADERISLYERLRARLMVLPESQRSAFVNALLNLMRTSMEPFAGAPVQLSGTTIKPTIGGWVTAFEAAQGPKNPDAFFAQPEFTKLDDTTNHTIRHLMHLVTLLADPQSSAPTIPSRPMTKSPSEPPSPPANLPVEPTVRPVPVPSPSKESVPMPVPLQPVRPQPQPASMPILPPVPTASTVNTVPEPPRSVPSAAPMADRGPTVASVLAKLKQTQLDTIAAPPTVAHLTPEDEAEIKQHAENLTSIDAGPNVHDTVSDTVANIEKEFGVTFPDEHLEKRFSSIITARLKDIRNSSDTLDLLTRGLKVGGLGLDPELAEKIMMKATSEATKFTTEDGVKKLMEQQQTISSLPQPPKVPAEPKPVAPPPSIPIQQFAATAPPPVRRPDAAVTVPVQQVRTVPVAPPSMPTASFRPLSTDRKTVSDIKGSSRLVGPVEELRAMTLADYRRLAPDALGCIRRLYEKMQQLGKESFSKRAQGVKAWRESEAYRLYVTIGQESLQQAKTVADVIATRQQLGQPTLTDQEISYIADLNRKLRF